MSNENTDLHPGWETARTLLAGVKQALRVSLAGQVLLGQELASLKKDLGFHHGNNQHGRIGQAVSSSPATWMEWVKQELDVSSRTADRWIEMFDAAKARVKKIGVTPDLIGGTKKLELLFTSRPSTMADEDREKLQQVVERLTFGSTQSELLEELRLVKKHDSSGIGGDTSKHKKEQPSEGQKMAQLAFIFLRPLADTLHGLRTNPDREAFLHTIQIASGDENEITLTSLENDLEAALADVRKAKKDRMKLTPGKVIA